MVAGERNTMNVNVQKAVRTAITLFPFLKSTKEWVHYHVRKALKRPHEQDFQIVRRFTGPDCLFIDVGANHGQSINSITTIRPNARILSFEANVRLATKLKKRYRINHNINIQPFGLGDQPGEFTLYLPTYNGYLFDGLASINRIEAEEWLCEKWLFFFDRKKVSVQELPCVVRTLDEFGVNPVFIKIDVQGFEYEVLKGAASTLARAEPLLLIEDASADPRIVEFLASMGYKECFLMQHTLAFGRGTGPNSFFSTAKWAHFFLPLA